MTAAGTTFAGFGTPSAAGQAATKSVAAAAPRPYVQSCPLDVSLILDTTGSMGGALNNVKTNIGNIINTVAAVSGGNYQLGLVTFKDNVVVNNTLASGNQAAVSASVNGLSAAGGGAAPEASDEAVNTTVNSLGGFTNAWRSNALKIAVLVTDALPGGFDDTYTPGVDDVNAHTRAVQAGTNGIGIDAVYVPTGGAPDATVVSIMSDYSNTSGGIFTQTTADGSGTSNAITASIGTACRSKKDVYMRDFAGDPGTEPQAANSYVWFSPDIKVCQTSGTPNCPPSNPVVGVTNYVYVTLNNPGPSGTGTAVGAVDLRYTPQGGNAYWPSDWNAIGTSALTTVGPGATTVEIPWTAVPGPGHFCLLARWISSGDPMAFAEPVNSLTVTNARNNNNIAWHNVDTIKLKKGGNPVKRTFRVMGFERKAGGLHIVAPLVGIGGGVTIDVGAALAKRMRASGQTNSGVEQISDTSFAVIDPQNAQLNGMLLKLHESFFLKVTFTPSPNPSNGPLPVFINQLDAAQNDVGGVEFDTIVR